jgi:hypothetical protein
MEQTIQLLRQKPSIPIKTKVAVWWTIIIGVYEILYAILKYFLLGKKSRYLFNYLVPRELVGFIIIIEGLFFIIPSLIILRKKKYGWWFSVIVIFLELLDSLPLISVMPLTFFTAIIPFILLLIDRKNFFKIAS